MPAIAQLSIPLLLTILSLVAGSLVATPREGEAPGLRLCRQLGNGMALCIVVCDALGAWFPSRSFAWWVVLAHLAGSMLTGRHSGSFESTWEQDIRRIGEQGPANYLKQVEESELSDTFWAVTLPAALETTSTVSPFFQTFLAAQVANNSRGFLAKSITVAAMTQQSGDIHHIVPKDYLQKHGYPDRGDYNQVANFALTETSVNISISNKPPAEYMAVVARQLETGILTLGEITDPTDLARNLSENAIPGHLAEVTAGSYREFLSQRRKLMASVIRDYYQSL